MPRLSAAFFAALILIMGVALPVKAAETTLRISLQLPLKSHLGQNLVLFKDEVEKASEGKIEVQIYDSAQLFKDKEVPQAVGSGQIEMGVASLTRFVGEIPAVDIFYQPFLLNTEELVRAATNKDSTIRGPIDEAILKTGSRVLWWQAYGGSIMLSKGAPFKTPADVEGKKVRVFSKTLGRWVEAVGGVPTLTAGSEQYLAYQRGTVDAGMTGISGVKARKLWDVMDHITVTNNADIEFIVLVNEAFWQSLPDAQKAIIQAAADKADVTVRDDIARIEKEAYEAAEQNGMTIYRPTAEEIELWKASAKPVIDAYLAESGDLGKQLYEAALALQK
ncbi:MAG: TRAP transporter substrate-binding protein DctP [Rhodospirillales bacterium]|nr:TRAP transporter substrate-binding protein DctP [Rhodospirillales bacterium]